MNLKDAAANLNQAHPEDTLHPLYTPWGEMLMRSGSYDDILSEYPRPQMKRSDYHILNGLWEYAFVPADGSKASEDPASFISQGSIRVPFSPEALLSGVHRRLEPTEYLWYHRELSFSTEELSQKEETMRCILHFDAVDQEATVFLGTKQLGIHSGGYLVSPKGSCCSEILRTRIRMREPVFPCARVPSQEGGLTRNSRWLNGFGEHRMKVTEALLYFGVIL